MKEESKSLRHIAIIMDGNRRWAKANGLDAREGHKEGAENLQRISRSCKKLGIKYLTVYAFSVENWKRSEEEVGALMFLLQNYLKDFAKKSDTEDIRINVIGNIEALSKGLQKEINSAMERTRNNTGLVLNIAFNYGGRDEITRAVKKIAEKVKNNQLKIDEITNDIVSGEMYTSGQPDPDLVIRTSGELRTSNFLPWQIVYSEFYFPEKHWPEFTEQDLIKAIEIYQDRNRRFGGNK